MDKACDDGQTAPLDQEGAADFDLGGVVACFSGSFLIRAAAAAGGTLISLFLASLHSSGMDVHARFVGLSAVLFYSAELIGSPGFGMLSDMKGRKPFMVLGPVLGGLAIQIIVMSPAVIFVLLARFLQGTSTATSVPSTLSYLSAESSQSEKLRGRIMSAFEVVTVVGIAAGFAAGGVLWDAFGHSAFFMVVGIYVASCALFLLVKDSHHPRSGQAVARPAGPARYFAFLRSGSALRLIPAWISVNAVVGLWFSHIDFQMAKAGDYPQLLVGGFTGREIGLYTGAIALLFVLGIALWGLSFNWLRSTQIMPISLVGLFFLVGVVYSLNNTGHDEPARIGALLLAGSVCLLVVSGFTPAALTYLADIAEEFPETRGSLMGLYSVFLGLGQALGGGLGGYFADWQGVNGMIIFTGILGLVASVFVADLIRQERCRPPSSGPAGPRLPRSTHL